MTTPPSERKHRGIFLQLEETVPSVFILHRFHDLIKPTKYSYQASIFQLQSYPFALLCFVLQAILTGTSAVKIAKTHGEVLQQYDTTVEHPHPTPIVSKLTTNLPTTNVNQNLTAAMQYHAPSPTGSEIHLDIQPPR